MTKKGQNKGKGKGKGNGDKNEMGLFVEERNAQLVGMGFSDLSIGRLSQLLPPEATVQDFVDKQEELDEEHKQKEEDRVRALEEEKRTQTGYRLEPKVSTMSDSSGDIFLCSESRGNGVEKKVLKNYRFLRCWYSLKGLVHCVRCQSIFDWLPFHNSLFTFDRVDVI